jgi:hypothetical protein
MVTKQRLEAGRLLKHPNNSGAHSKTMFLFAGNFTRVATTTIFLIKFYRYLSHVNLLFIFTGIDIA